MVNGAVPAAELITEFEVPSAEGNERLAIERVVAAVDGLGLAEGRLERLKTAVGEATMNAMEHGSRYREDRPVSVRVLTGDGLVRVQITDLGGAPPELEHEQPDIEAKLEGLQRPRGWGLFLIENMVDETRETSDGEHHTLELGLRLEGDDDGDE
jgi:anti-sigma regulatory factor (Ser/Thr protein kinase)